MFHGSGEGAFALERVELGLGGLLDRVDAADFVGERFVPEIVESGSGIDVSSRD
jgi:hypothetical protein